MTLFLNGISQYEVNDIINQKTTAVQYIQNRKHKMAELQVTIEHARLMDALFVEIDKNILRFLKHGVTIDNLDSPENITHYLNARKAAIEYYFFEPLMPEEVLQKMRTQ